MMERIVLIGGGGHCKSVIDVIIQQGKYEIAAIVDRLEDCGKMVCGYQIAWIDDDLPTLFADGHHLAAITVGGIGDFSLREKLFRMAKGIGFQFPPLIDPSAVVSRFAQIGEGVFIGKNCVVNAEASIGNMAIINTAAVVEHDCMIGEYAFLAPSVTLSGGVTIGEHTHIGTGANVIQNLNIGNHSLIGAGSVVTHSLGNCIKAYGNPCREVF